MHYDDHDHNKACCRRLRPRLRHRVRRRLFVVLITVVFVVSAFLIVFGVHGRVRLRGPRRG